MTVKKELWFENVNNAIMNLETDIRSINVLFIGFELVLGLMRKKLIDGWEKNNG